MKHEVEVKLAILCVSFLYQITLRRYLFVLTDINSLNFRETIENQDKLKIVGLK